MTRKKLWAVLAALALVTAAFAAPALARKGDGERGGGHGRGKARPAQTRMRFRLDDHQLALGEAATGVVTLTTRDGRNWGPLEGATLTVVLKNSDDCDGDCPNDDVVAPTAVTECATLTTDAEGHATVSCVAAAEGEYVVKVFYDGDDTHKRSKRAQGFTVGVGDDEGEDEDEVDPTPTPEPTETTI